MIHRIGLVGVAVLSVVGCNSTTSSDGSRPTDNLLGQQHVTFYVEGMNERLKIL